MSTKVYLSKANNISKVQYQICHMPVELLKLLNIRVKDPIYIEVNNRGIICKAHPTFYSYITIGYQVLAAYHMIHNVTNVRDFYCDNEILLDVNNITALNIVDIVEADISVVLTSVDGVKWARKYPMAFKESVLGILTDYFIMNTSVVNCSSNPVAKFLKISYIIINQLKLNESDSCENSKYAGRATENTKINFSFIESEERHFHVINDGTSLGGLDEILEDLKNMVTYRWSKYGKIASGILLIGPPGCGKSSLVRQLCYQTQACLVATAGAELQSPYEGETLQNFEKVAKKACSISEEGLCIFFVDEIDSIGIAVTEETSSEDIELTTLVLDVIDECKKYPNLIMMAATNRPYVLDRRIRRSGRLDREVMLSAPTQNERRCILEIYCKGLLPNSHPSLDEVAASTPGFVGADLKFLCEKVWEKFLANSTAKEPLHLDPSEISREMLQLSTAMTPSIHKSLDFITRKPKASPVGGLEHIKKKLNLLFSSQNSKYAETLKLYKLKKPKGFLFYGPRGCGKTRLVSEVASRRGFSFFSANSAHLLSPYVGESEKRIAALFHAARLAQPSIIFIDEIDGIFGSRESAGAGVRVNLLTELLQAMDGVDIGATSRQGSRRMANEVGDFQDDILVCAATNHPDNLDSALLRPGRFDYLIYIPPPDLEARRDILKLKTSKLKIDASLLEEIAVKTEMWTGAQLETLISRVALQAIKAENCNRETKEIFIYKDVLWKEFEDFAPALCEKDLKKFEEFRHKFGKVL